MAARSSPRERVALPAAALFVTGVLGALSALGFGAAALYAWIEDREARQVTLDAPESEAEVLVDLFGGGFLLVGMGAGVGIGVAVVVGARRMRRLRNRPFAIASAALAMLPVSVGCLLGVPVGLWVLWILTRPDVRAGFEEVIRESQAVSDAEFWGADAP